MNRFKTIKTVRISKFIRQVTETMTDMPAEGTGHHFDDGHEQRSLKHHK